ncbi:MAG: hypothetical protein WBG92_06255 [Thiohalocapsa sp.]
MTTPDGRDPNEQPDLASHLHGQSAADPGAPAPTPRVMQDMEKSLVERIADVDDERRRTSTQVRKALQTHRDEVELRLRAYRNTLVGLSVLTALLAAGVLWLGAGLHLQRAQLAGMVEQQRAQPADPPVNAGPGPISTGVNARIDDIERELALLAAQRSEVPPVPAVPPVSLADTIDGLTERIDTIETGIQSLRSAPSNTRMANAEASTPDSPQPVEAGQVAPSARDATDTALRVESAATANDRGDQEPRPDDTPPKTETGQTETGQEAMQTSAATVALQLIGFRSRDEMREFIASHRLPDVLYVRTESYRERPWYALIHSLYDDRAGAGDAMARLPDDLAQLDIWLRELPTGTTLERVRNPNDN